MRKIISYMLLGFAFLLLTTNCKKKYLATENTIYNGYVHFNGNTDYNLKGEFRFNANTFTLMNDSVSLEILLDYDEKTKELTGSFHDIYDLVRNVKGKKIGDDFVLEIFVDYIFSTENLDNPDLQIGSIYLTPKK